MENKTKTVKVIHNGSPLTSSRNPRLNNSANIEYGEFISHDEQYLRLWINGGMRSIPSHNVIDIQEVETNPVTVAISLYSMGLICEDEYKRIIQ